MHVYLQPRGHRKGVKYHWDAYLRTRKRNGRDFLRIYLLTFLSRLAMENPTLTRTY